MFASRLGSRYLISGMSFCGWLARQGRLYPNVEA